ncbi:MAG TPA: DUF4019 domain-containing protein [Caulobacteraceae bacterium]|jgi:hypothetical protein
MATLAGQATAAPASRDPTSEAKAWLRLVDQGRYADSWTRGGSLFRDSATAAEWARKVGVTRIPMGKLISRQAGADQRSTTLPGLPDGHYSTIRFSTIFAHKQAAIETVILAQEPGGWKVDGYFLR